VRRRLARYANTRAQYWWVRAEELSDFIVESASAGLPVSPRTLETRRYCRRQSVRWAQLAELVSP
jgi:hypothetical protein